MITLIAFTFFVINKLNISERPATKKLKQGVSFGDSVIGYRGEVRFDLLSRAHLLCKGSDHSVSPLSLCERKRLEVTYWLRVKGYILVRG